MMPVSPLLVTETGFPRVNLTETAARVVREACQAEGKSLAEICLRIGARSGGCSGYKYELEMQEIQQIQPSDARFELHGIPVVVDQTCLTEILGPLEIDYRTGNLVEEGFVFKQLVGGRQCGCGESFTAIKDL